MSAARRFAHIPNTGTQHKQVQLPAQILVVDVRLTRYRIKRWRVSNLQRGAVPQARHRHVADSVDEQEGYTRVQRLVRMAAIAGHCARVVRSIVSPGSS